MNNTEPLNIQQDPNMLDDVVRFYESEITNDEQDGIRSPFLSTFTIDEYRESTGLGGPFPRFTATTDSYGSFDLEPDRTTQRTTTAINDGYKTVKGYRALKSGRYIIEGPITTSGNLNGVYGLRLATYDGGYTETQVTQSPRIITNGGFFTQVMECNYRACIYMKGGQYFIMQLYINASTPRTIGINGKLKVFCIEDKYITGQTLSQ